MYFIAETAAGARYDVHPLAIEEREVITPDFKRKKLLVVLVQLFADFDMPAHEVVVGEL